MHHCFFGGSINQSSIFPIHEEILLLYLWEVAFSFFFFLNFVLILMGKRISKMENGGRGGRSSSFWNYFSEDSTKCSKPCKED